MIKRKMTWLTVIFVGIVITLLVSTKSSSATTKADDTCISPQQNFLFLPWNTNSGGDWLSRMTAALDHDFPNYDGTYRTIPQTLDGYQYDNPVGQRIMRIALWTGEIARPKHYPGDVSNNGWCNGVVCENSTFRQTRIPGSDFGQFAYIAVTDESSAVYYDGHDAYDWAITGGTSTDILAAATGRVSEIKYDSAWLGTRIVIDHGNHFKTAYSHLKNGSVLVQVGQCVNAGQPIAKQGNSSGGKHPSTMGVHLHFQVYHDEKLTDPFGWCDGCINPPADPLQGFNGETSQVLWYGIEPRSVGLPPSRNDLQISWTNVSFRNIGGDGFNDIPNSPTSTPETIPTNQSPTSGWNVKFYSSVEECSFPSCAPGSVYQQKTVSGTSVNLNFADGKAFGSGPGTWGSIWKQTAYFPTGTYYFHANHDDGVKVFLGDTNIMDVGPSENNTACPGRQLSGNVPLTIIWKNTGGPASLNLWWDQDGSSCGGSGGGSSSWYVRWYEDYNQCSQIDCSPSPFRTDTIGGQGIYLNFSDGKVFGDRDDTWGSIWKTTINFPEGDYVFHADHDDGVKLFLWDTNIMDVGPSENNQACPARHLSGNVDLTVIWKNTGGPAHLNLWWDTNSSVCNPAPPPEYNLWVWKDAGNQTHAVTDGPAAVVHYYLYGDSTEKTTTPSWTSNGQGAIEFIVPENWESLLVEGTVHTNLSSPNTDEWFVWTDGHWVGRKRLDIWIDGEEYTRLTYKNQDFATRQPIHYWINGQETISSDLWYIVGSGIEAKLPREADAIHVEAWITPKTNDYSYGYWKIDGDSILRRTVEVYTDQTGTRVTYYHGLPGTEVLLGVYGQPLQTRTDLWQTAGDNLYFYLPQNVISFMVKGGPLPLIQPWAAGVWHQPYSTSHWVEQSTVWVYKYQQDTLVRYMNPTEGIPATIYLWYEGGQTQQAVTNLWYKVIGGWEFKVPNNAVSFMVGGGPVPIRTDSTSAEWFVNQNDNHWTERRFIRVWVASWGTTYVTYWLNTTYKPNIHYWLNNAEIVTNNWQPTQDGTGLQFAIPNGVQSFKVDAWILPQLLASTAGKWEIKNLLDPWVTKFPLNYLYLPIVKS